MRWIGFAALISLALVLTQPAAAAWQEYMYSDLGIAKDFPAAPRIENGTYRTAVVGEAPAVIHAVEEDHIVYKMTVADLRAPEYVARSASILAECISLAEQEGVVLAKLPQRVEDGTDYRVYGHLTSVDLFESQGRKQTNCFYTKGRLFKIEAIVLPGHGEPNSSMAIRFSTSLRFRIDGTHYNPP